MKFSPINLLLLIVCMSLFAFMVFHTGQSIASRDWFDAFLCLLTAVIWAACAREQVRKITK